MGLNNKNQKKREIKKLDKPALIISVI